jgi:hypothetical protein
MLDNSNYCCNNFIVTTMWYATEIPQRVTYATKKWPPTKKPINRAKRIGNNNGKLWANKQQGYFSGNYS